MQTLDPSVASRAYRRAGIAERLAAIDQRVAAIDQHLSAIGQRLSAISQGASAVDPAPARSRQQPRGLLEKMGILVTRQPLPA